MKEHAVWSKAGAVIVLQTITPHEDQAWGEVARLKLTEDAECLVTEHDINIQRRSYERWQRNGLGRFASRSLFQARRPKVLSSLNYLASQLPEFRSNRPLDVMNSDFWWNRQHAVVHMDGRLQTLCRESKTSFPNAKRVAQATKDDILASLLGHYKWSTKNLFANKIKTQLLAGKIVHDELEISVANLADGLGNSSPKIPEISAIWIDEIAPFHSKE